MLLETWLKERHQCQNIHANLCSSPVYSICHGLDRKHRKQQIMMEMSDRNVPGKDRRFKWKCMPCCLEELASLLLPGSQWIMDLTVLFD